MLSVGTFALKTMHLLGNKHYPLLWDLRVCPTDSNQGPSGYEMESKNRCLGPSEWVCKGDLMIFDCQERSRFSYTKNLTYGFWIAHYTMDGVPIVN
jgi:hypothetical protein